MPDYFFIKPDLVSLFNLFVITHNGSLRKED